MVAYVRKHIIKYSLHLLIIKRVFSKKDVYMYCLFTQANTLKCGTLTNRCADRWKDLQMDRHVYVQMDRPMHRQMDILTDEETAVQIETGIQTDGQTYNILTYRETDIWTDAQTNENADG